MERILKYLPRSAAPLAARLLIATALVGLSFLLVIVLRRTEGLLAFYVLLPCVFVVSVVFERGTGLFAAALCTALLYGLLTPSGSLLLPREYLVPLVGFTAIAAGFAIVSGTLRTAWERAAVAEQAKDLLLRELAHRTKNNLMMVASLLSLQARLKTNAETRHALEKAVARVQAIASAHEHFQPVEHKGRVEMRAYLEQLCRHLGDAMRDVRPIAIQVEAAQVFLPAEQAIPVGLMVNELVTNSLKHAFNVERAGTIQVSLRHGSGLTLTITDDGVGCPAIRAEGVGTRLIRLLARQLGAHVEWEHPGSGCQVRIALPNSDRNIFGRKERGLADAEQPNQLATGANTAP